MPNLEQWKGRARRLKAETHALYLATRHPQTPWAARLLAAAVVAYALSPIDLIPDVIPVLGYLDDLLLVPLGLALALRWIPPGVMAECRKQAQETSFGQPGNRWGAALVVVLWILLIGLGAAWLHSALR
ncbi:MAG: DUF1232 domain-containing protein [Chloroflexi bacterium]|nr:DUF1232 domain-containing protein [Chloroflexota bacterium]